MPFDFPLAGAPGRAIDSSPCYGLNPDWDYLTSGTALGFTAITAINNINTIYVSPFCAPIDLTISQFGVTASHPNTGARLAIYAMGSNHLPGNLLYDFGGAVGAEIRITGLSAFLPAGWYWAAFKRYNGSVGMIYSTSSGEWGGFFGSTGFISANPPTDLWAWRGDVGFHLATDPFPVTFSAAAGLQASYNFFYRVAP